MRVASVRGKQRVHIPPTYPHWTMSSDTPRLDPLLKHRVIVLLTERDLAALDRLRRQDNRSRSGMLRQALRLLAKSNERRAS